MPGTRRRRRENPPGNQPGIRAQPPALLGGEIDERKFGFRRSRQLILAPDRRQEFSRIVIPGQKQMIAIVDRHAKRRVVKGPAAPAGLPRGLVQHDFAGSTRKAHRRGEPGKSRADDMDSGLIH